MKKIKYLLLIVFLIPITSKAATINCSAPSSVQVGETFNVTFYGSLSSPASVWFANIGSSNNVSYQSGGLSIDGDDEKDMSHTVSFKANSSGDASFYAYDVDVSDGNNTYSDSATCYVTITEPTTSNSSSSYSYDDNEEEETKNEDNKDKSSDNYLKSLSIKDVKISPTFNKDKLEYTAVVSGDKDKITIEGEGNDSKSTVEGLGEKELKEGINKFEIKVTAENGESKTYTIMVTRKESNPIEIIIDKKKYTVLKKDIGLKVPEDFVKTSVIIEKEEVLAYSNKFTGYLIVALVDEEGNASWYIYNQKNGTYTKYYEITSGNVRLIILKPNKKDIPYKYRQIAFEINGEKVDGYALEFTSPYRLVYALNMATGEKDFYLYDIEQNTFQRFYNKQVEIYRGLLKKLEIGIIGLISIIGIMLIIILSQIAINKKTKKFIKSGGKKEKDDLNVLVKEEEKHDKEEEKLEKTKALEKIDKTSKIKPVVKEKELSKSDLKRLKKEEEKRLKKERREFFK